MIFFGKSALPIMLFALTGCATQGKPPPSIRSMSRCIPAAAGAAYACGGSGWRRCRMPAWYVPAPDAKSVAEPADETVCACLRQRRGAYCAHARGLRQREIQAWLTDGALYQFMRPWAA